VLTMGLGYVWLDAGMHQATLCLATGMLAPVIDVDGIHMAFGFFISYWKL